MDDKTTIYNEQIRTLLHQIHGIAITNNIPFIAIFQPNDTNFTGSLNITQHASKHMKDSAKWWMEDVDVIEVREHYGERNNEPRELTKDEIVQIAKDSIESDLRAIELFSREPVTFTDDQKEAIAAGFRAQELLGKIRTTALCTIASGDEHGSIGFITGLGEIIDICDRTNNAIQIDRLLAQKILEWISKTEEEVRTTLQGSLEVVASLSGLIINIKELCQGAVKQ